LPYKDSKIFDRYIEGLIKAGFEGNPSGYYKLNDEEKLSGKEIRNLVYGKISSGNAWGYEWSISSFKNGNIKANISFMFEYNGKEWIEDDSICRQYEDRFDGLKECSEIFYNPQGNDQDKSRYLAVTDYGILPFSVEDATTQ
jgi:hypothetical protein